MTVLPFRPRLSFLDAFRAAWRAGDYADCITGTSMMVREDQNECIVAAVELKREALEAGATIETIRAMDTAIRMLGESAAGAATRAEREQVTKLCCSL